MSLLRRKYPLSARVVKTVADQVLLMEYSILLHQTKPNQDTLGINHQLNNRHLIISLAGPFLKRIQFLCFLFLRQRRLKLLMKLKALTSKPVLLSLDTGVHKAIVKKFNYQLN